MRRRLFKLVGIASLWAGRARAARLVTAGAIRWDAWDAEGSIVSSAVEATLGPEIYHDRAPFCAIPQGTDRIGFAACRTPRAMDFEIAAAAEAGLGYWAYCWYGPGSPMMNAWALHQASGIRDKMKWCLLLQFSRLGGPGSFTEAGGDYRRYFAQPNYQAVNGRPLVYLLIDNPAHLNTDWAGDWGRFAAAWRGLARACAAAPYLVIMSGRPAQAAEIMKAAGADAISSYIGPVPPGEAVAYAELDRALRQYWRGMAATGAATVPVCMTGWDPRPRRAHPPPWGLGGTARGRRDYVAAGTPAQIAAHIRAGIDFVRDRQKSCAAGTIIIYSWNECDEGGSALVPSYTENGPNGAILAQAGQVMRAGALVF